MNLDIRSGHSKIKRVSDFHKNISMNRMIEICWIPIIIPNIKIIIRILFRFASIFFIYFKVIYCSSEQMLIIK